MTTKRSSNRSVKKPIRGPKTILQVHYPVISQSTADPTNRRGIERKAKGNRAAGGSRPIKNRLNKAAKKSSNVSQTKKEKRG